MMIFEKLSQIQKRLFVPKANRNDFGKYNYRSCEDILKTVKPLCEELGCVLLMDSEIRVDNGITHIMATAILHDLEDGSEIKSTAGAREEDSKKGMDGSQISGASLSYARKYALNGLFDIDDTKDSDTTNTGGKEQPKEKPKEYKCECCGKSFAEFDWNGRHYTAGQAYEMSKKKNGKPLCKKCADAQRTEQVNINDI